MNRSSRLLPVLLGAVAGMAAAGATLPAGTPPIRRKKDGSRGTIARLEKVVLGGAEQWILVRSEDVANPVLLFLHGGPGFSQMGLGRRHTRALEPYFTVVNWDQRGAGKSHRAIRDRSKMTIDRFIEDTRELAQYLLQQSGQQRIFLVGRSWGSALGMLTVARYPELFHAYVGIGQISNMAESEKASYQWTLEQAIAREDRKAIRQLEAMGPPPYSGDWYTKFTTQRKYVTEYGGEIHGNPIGSNGMIVRNVLFSPEYSLADRFAYKGAVEQSLRLLQPQLMQVDLFREAAEVQVPVFLAGGRYDRVVPVALAHRYFEALRAPRKEWIPFAHSAHMPEIEERERFHRFLIARVLPLAGNLPAAAKGPGPYA